MNDIRARDYLLGKPEAYEDFPFGPQVQVYKVKKKIFATLTYARGVARINLKCDPQEALILRDLFDAVIPGYHMNKTHWNTVILDGSIPAEEIMRMIDRSYTLVVKSMPKAERLSLEVAYDRQALYK